MKIGFFDSGSGGLAIMRAVQERLPRYDYVFLGDTMNVPYGSKTRDHIHELTREGIELLYKRGASMVIVACNTASVEALPIVQSDIHSNHYAERRVLGVVIPAVEAIVASGLQRIHLVGTKRTIQSGKYEHELGIRTDSITLTSEATPELVPLIEAGDLSKASEYLFQYLDPRVGEIEGVMLGCTHYSLIKEFVRDRYGDRLEVFSQDEIIPEKLKDYLSRHQMFRKILTQGGTEDIVWTGAVPGSV